MVKKNGVHDCVHSGYLKQKIQKDS